MGALKLVDWLA